MKRILVLAGILTALSMGIPAYADDEGCNVAMSQWQSRDAVKNMAQTQGWDVRQIKIDDGCYEIKGFDTSGREIEVKIDPATLAIVEFEYEDDEHDENENDEYTNNSSGGVAPSTSLSPPNNGLFSQDAAPVVVSQ